MLQQEHRNSTVRVQTQHKSLKDLPKHTRKFGRDLTNAPARQLSPVQTPDTAFLYVQQIFRYVTDTEETYRINEDFLDRQTDISSMTRGILVDWLVDVHQKFKLVPDTLHLSVNLVDRYLERVTLPKSRFQLLGIACTLVAAKCEQIVVPTLNELIYLCDNLFNRQQILEMQSSILQTMDFKLTPTSVYRFIDRISSTITLEPKLHHFSTYIAELCLLKSDFCKYLASQVAIAASYLTCKIFGRRSDPIYKQSLRRCVREMLGMLRELPEWSLQAVRRKFSSEKYSKVSQIILDFKN